MIGGTHEADMLAEYESEYPTHCVGVARFEQDCGDWWEHAKTALSGALARAGVSAREAALVAVSSQAPSMLPVDGRGRALRPAMIWMDRRSDAQCQAMNRRLGEDRVFALTGNAADPFYTFSEL